MTPLAKATLTAEYSTGAIEIFEVQYNPTEFSLDKGIQLAEIAIPGLDSPLLQFVRGQAEKLSVDLFFDTTDSGIARPVSHTSSSTPPRRACSMSEISAAMRHWRGWAFSSCATAICGCIGILSS